MEYWISEKGLMLIWALPLASLGTMLFATFLFNSWASGLIALPVIPGVVFYTFWVAGAEDHINVLEFLGILAIVIIGSILMGVFSDKLPRRKKDSAGCEGVEKKQIIPVVAACITTKIHFPDVLVFLLHKKDEPRNKELLGKWEFPGGMMEYGEESEFSLRREIREELGKEIIMGRLVHAQTNIYKDGKHYLVLFYHCLLPEELPPVAGFKWFNLEEIRIIDTLPGTLEVAELCLSHCRAWEGET